MQRIEKSRNITLEALYDEWYTPKAIIDSLGTFDLDPCSPHKRLWDTASYHYTKDDDGLAQEWFGRVWLNPPYSNPSRIRFLERMALHDNGTALLQVKFNAKWFHDIVFDRATAMLILYDRIKFYRPDGSQGLQPRNSSVLIAYGQKDAGILKNCDLKGKFFLLK